MIKDYFLSIPVGLLHNLLKPEHVLGLFSQRHAHIVLLFHFAICLLCGVLVFETQTNK